MTHQPFRELAVKAFRARLESFGIDPLELIETATLNRNSINHGQEPPSVHEVLETAVTMSGDPAIAIRIGEDIDLAAYGTYGFAIMSSADMGAALDIFLRYGQSFILSSSWHRSDYEDGLILRLEQNTGTHYQQMLLTELSFSHLHGNSQLLVAKPAEGVRVHLNYPRPKHFEVYEENWAHSIEFDQEHSQIFLPNHWLRQRVRTGDPTTNVLFSQQCEEIVSGMTEVDETAASCAAYSFIQPGIFSVSLKSQNNYTLPSEHSGAAWRLREQISGQSSMTSRTRLPGIICVKHHSASWK